MPDLSALLKAEISRIARRALRPYYLPIKKDVAVVKKTISQHKRLLAQVSREHARLIADLNARIAAPTAASAEETRQARVSPRLILSQRKRLGLSRDGFGKLLGVSGGAVSAWEGGRSRPRTAAKAALVAARKLGRREARQKLEILAGPTGAGKPNGVGRRSAT